MQCTVIRISIHRLIALGCLLLLSVLSSCDRPSNRLIPQDERGNFAKQAVHTSLYNYTDFEIADVVFDDSTRPFDVRVAALGGSTFFHLESTEDIGGGLKAHVSHGACCFMWNYRGSDDVRLRIAWLVIHDPAVYASASRLNDDRASSTPLPGSEWCEAYAKVEKPFPADPSQLTLHFLPDGSVAARLFGLGSAARKSLTKDDVVKFTPSLPAPNCKRSISNPWYNIPREPHRE